MSSCVNQYLIFGYRLDYDEAKALLEATHGEKSDEMQDKYDDNGYQKEIGHFEGVTFIADGMNGEYAYFGIIKEKARIDDWLSNISIGKAKPKDVRLVQAQAQVFFGRAIETLPGWHLLTHWH